MDGLRKEGKTRCAWALHLDEPESPAYLALIESLISG